MPEEEECQLAAVGGILYRVHHLGRFPRRLLVVPTQAGELGERVYDDELGADLLRLLRGRSDDGVPLEGSRILEWQDVKVFTVQ